MSSSYDRMKARVAFRGDASSADQWTRMRQDKLRSMKGALYYSYQAAIVQKYIASQGNNQTSPYFRCLINHDKLKVDYEDKLISIPFEENSVSIDPVKDNKDWLETGFTPGTTFRWIHGNKAEWTPDSYWIVYLQYSEETAYFRGQIRKADDQIVIIKVEDDGTETEQVYHGWTTGPDETSIFWNVKKGVIWNDLNYTKELYITKDSTTEAFFKRFDRVKINGQPWEVQAFNDNYGSSSSNKDTGIIRVALKETYTDTDTQIKEMKQEQQTQDAVIIGPDVLSPYDRNIKYVVKNAADGAWKLQLTAAAAGETLNKYISYTIDGDTLVINVETSKSYKKGFDIKYGDITKHITIKSL